MYSDQNIHEYIRYDRKTGQFFWIKSHSRYSKPGKPVHMNTCNGYYRVIFKKKSYAAHRVAWRLMTGYWPDHEIDHKNRNGFDNRWSNLRKATHSQNQANVSARITNTSGYKGVSFCKRDKKYRASISCNKSYISLGYYKTAEDAHKAYENAAKRLFGEFARAS